MKIKIFYEAEEEKSFTNLLQFYINKIYLKRQCGNEIHCIIQTLLMHYSN